MNLNLNNDERNYLGETNLDSFFSHLNFSVDHPEIIKTIPNNSTVVYKDAGNEWVNAQNDKLAEQAVANGENVHRVKVIEKFSMSFPDGRKIIFNTDYLWNTKEASQITGLNFKQINYLGKEKAVVGFSIDILNKKDRYFEFSQVLQLQAYKLILKQKQQNQGFGQSFILKGSDLQKILKYYADYELKVKALDHFPVLFNEQIFSIAPDMSGSQEFLSTLSTLDWRSDSVRIASIYPPLLEVMKQLCDNAWKLRESQVWTQKELEERLMVAA